MFGEIIAIIVFIVVIVGIYYLLFHNMVRKMANNRNKAKELNATKHGTLKHISGLPLARDTEVELFVCPTEYICFGANQEFAINYNKIISVDRVEGKGDPSKQMSDAAVGGLLFGTAGALIGGISTGSNCLVITYKTNDSDENKFVILEGNNANGFIKKVVKQFDKNIKTTTTPIRTNL